MKSSGTVFSVAELEAKGWLLVEDGNHGEYRPRPDEFGHGDVLFIRAADMDAGQVLFESAERIAPIAVNRIRKGIGRPGDILFSHKGTVGKIARVPSDAPAFVCSPQTTFWRTIDEKRIGARYLYYYMQSTEFLEQWRARMGETDMAPYVSLTAQRELFVRLPPIEYQLKFGAALGSLDDKLAACQSMNRTIEKLTAALFEKWLTSNEEHLAERPVEELLKADKLYLSDGYRAKNSEMAAAGLPFARAGNLNGGFSFEGADILGQAGVSAAGQKVACTYDAVFTSKGTVGRIALVLPSTPKFVYSPQLCFWRSRDHAFLHPLILHRWMCGPEFRDQVDAVKGQTDMADYVNLRDQRAMTMTLPWGAPQAPLVKELELLVQLVDANVSTIRTLAALRDTLLPALLSGEITLKDAEKTVAKVV